MWLLNDNECRKTGSAKEEFQKQFGKDTFTAALLDVTNADTIEKAFDAAVLHLVE